MDWFGELSLKDQLCAEAVQPCGIGDKYSIALAVIRYPICQEIDEVTIIRHWSRDMWMWPVAPPDEMLRVGGDKRPCQRRNIWVSDIT